MKQSTIKNEIEKILLKIKFDNFNIEQAVEEIFDLCNKKK